MRLILPQIKKRSSWFECQHAAPPMASDGLYSGSVCRRGSKSFPQARDGMFWSRAIESKRLSQVQHNWTAQFGRLDFLQDRGQRLQEQRRFSMKLISRGVQKILFLNRGESAQQERVDMNRPVSRGPFQALQPTDKVLR